MANMPVKDGNGDLVRLKSSGTGTDGDPYIPEQATTVSGTVTANLGTIGGAATAANQATLIGHVDGLEALVAAVATQATLAAIQTLLGAGLPAALVGGRLSVDGSGVTQPVSAASLPLPTGAATQATLASVLSALQAALTVTATNLDIRDLSSATDSVAVTDGGSSLTVDGTVAVSGTVAVTDNGGALTVDGTVAVTDGGGSLTVDGPLTDVQLRATAVPVSAASLPLPTGASTAANQATIAGHVDGIETLLGGGLPSALATDRLKVDGSGVTQPVSAASLPLPTGAATEATLLDIQTAVEGTLAVTGTVTANLAAGTNNIGDVDVVTLPALVAGEAHVGEVGGRARLLTDSYTRPADTTTYAVGDALAESTSAPTALEFANAARVSGGSGEITGLVVVTSTAAATALAGELWVFAGSSAPTATNDNAAFNPSDSDALNVVAVIPFSVGSAGSSNRVYDVGPLACPYVCNATSLWGLVKVTNAYVPASAEVVTLGLRVRQN